MRSAIPRRQTLPFRRLLRRNDDEAWEEAMAVVDCSGTYARRRLKDPVPVV